MYALPYEFYEKYQIRRYGFHAPSHQYVSEKARELFGKEKDSSYDHVSFGKWIKAFRRS